MRKKIDELKYRFSTTKMYLMEKNKRTFTLVFKTKNENVTILHTKTNNAKTFIFVSMKMIKNSMTKKKKKINKINSFFEKSIVSTN